MNPVNKILGRDVSKNFSVGSIKGKVINTDGEGMQYIQIVNVDNNNVYYKIIDYGIREYGNPFNDLSRTKKVYSVLKRNISQRFPNVNWNNLVFENKNDYEE